MPLAPSNVVPFRRTVPKTGVKEISHWLVRSSEEADPNGEPGYLSWRLMVDDDGTIILVCEDSDEPPFAITACDDGFEALVCDPEDPEELGPFDTLGNALDGISYWLQLPRVYF
jgi:hypothetical protein